VSLPKLVRQTSTNPLAAPLGEVTTPPDPCDHRPTRGATLFRIPTSGLARCCRLGQGPNSQMKRLGGPRGRVSENLVVAASGVQTRHRADVARHCGLRRGGGPPCGRGGGPRGVGRLLRAERAAARDRARESVADEKRQFDQQREAEEAALVELRRKWEDLKANDPETVLQVSGEALEEIDAWLASSMSTSTRSRSCMWFRASLPFRSDTPKSERSHRSNPRLGRTPKKWVLPHARVRKPHRHAEGGLCRPTWRRPHSLQWSFGERNRPLSVCWRQHSTGVGSLPRISAQTVQSKSSTRLTDPSAWKRSAVWVNSCPSILMISPRSPHSWSRSRTSKKSRSGPSGQCSPSDQTSSVGRTGQTEAEA